mgnify:CR=1 FL=1
MLVEAKNASRASSVVSRGKPFYSQGSLESEKQKGATTFMFHVYNNKQQIVG